MPMCGEVTFVRETLSGMRDRRGATEISVESANAWLPLPRHLANFVAAN